MLDDRFAELCPALVQRLPMAVMLWRLDDLADDETLRFTGANPAANVVLGRDLAPWVGKLLKEVLPAMTAERRAVYAAIARSGSKTDIGEIVYGDELVARTTLSVSLLGLPDQCVASLFENRTAIAGRLRQGCRGPALPAPQQILRGHARARARRHPRQDRPRPFSGGASGVLPEQGS